MTGPLADAGLEKVKASARRYLDEMREHTTCCGVPIIRALLEETVALEVGLAACVDGGSYDMMKDHVRALLQQLEGQPVKHPQQTAEREAARAAIT